MYSLIVRVQNTVPHRQMSEGVPVLQVLLSVHFGPMGIRHCCLDSLITVCCPTRDAQIPLRFNPGLTERLILDIFIWVIGHALRIDPFNNNRPVKFALLTRFQLRLMWHCPLVYGRLTKTKRRCKRTATVLFANCHPPHPLRFPSITGS
jgi:hypothetical protein